MDGGDAAIAGWHTPMGSPSSVHGQPDQEDGDMGSEEDTGDMSHGNLTDHGSLSDSVSTLGSEMSDVREPEPVSDSMS